MPIKVSCVDCGESFQVKDELAGKRVKCRICAVPVRVPDEIDAEAAEDELPVSKKKAKKAASKKRGRSGNSAANATLMIRVGIGVAAALIIGVAIWAINGKVAANQEMAKQNDEINQRNAANAAADAAMNPNMATMGPAAMPGATPPGGAAMATPPGAPVAANPAMAGVMPATTPATPGAPMIMPTAAPGAPATTPMP